MIVWILVFLLLSAFFSGSEIAFVSANRLSIEVRQEQLRRRGAILRTFYNRAESFLGTMLVGNNIALVAFTSLTAALLTPLFEDLVQNSFLLFVLLTVLTTIIVLIFGEFIPKTLFKRYSTNMMYGLAYPLLFFKYVLWLPTKLVTGLSHLVIKYVFKDDMESIPMAYSRRDLEDFLEESIADDDEAVDADLLKRVIQFDQIKVRDCMVPRTEIHYIDIEDGLDEIIREFDESKKSRLLVVDDDLDVVLGYIHHQNLLNQPKRLKRQIMQMPIVPEAMRINDLLLKFIRERAGIACVVDEFGSTSGIVTLEDVLEEIFGEIEDEHDTEELLDKKIGDGTYLFSARHELDYIQENYPELEFPEGDFHTLSGYIVMTCGTIPDSGETIDLGSYRFTMEQVSEKKIEVVKLEIINDEESGD